MHIFFFFRTMPKCSHVVLLIISTNILTLTIYSSIKLNYDSLFSKIQKTSTWAQPQPQPFQYSRIQTGRVIQSLDEGHQDLTQYPKHQPIISSTEVSKVNKNKNLFSKRKQHIDEICEEKKKYPNEPFINDPTHLFVLQDRNVAWCPVFKAGSSTWLTILLDLSSLSEVSTYISLKSISNYIKILQKIS